MKPDEFRSIKDFFAAANFHPPADAEVDKKEVDDMNLTTLTGKPRPPTSKFVRDKDAMEYHRYMFPDYDKPLVNRRFGENLSPRGHNRANSKSGFKDRKTETQDLYRTFVENNPDLNEDEAAPVFSNEPILHEGELVDGTKET